MIDIIIAHSNSSKDRENNLKFSLEYYRKRIPTSNIIISEVNTETNIEEIQKFANNHHKIKSKIPFFSKSMVLNEGYKVSTSDHIMFIDNDCIIEESFFVELEKYLKMLDTCIILPYKSSVIDLTQTQTEFVLNGTTKLQEVEDLNYRIPSMGGIFIIKSENYKNVGGFDPRFIGYGAEDHAFIVKASRLYPIIRLDYKVFHLYHRRDFSGDSTDFNPEPNFTTKQNYYNNVKMLREYESFNKEQTIAKIYEIGFTHITAIKNIITE